MILSGILIGISKILSIELNAEMGKKLAHRGINTSTSRRVGKNAELLRDEPFFSHLIKSTF